MSTNSNAKGNGVLALDMARLTGWAYGELRCSGTEDLAYLPEETHGVKMLRFRGWLDRTFWPSAVVYEKAHHRGGAATLNGIGMQTVLQCWCHQRGAEAIGVHTATLKKHATGSGRAKKPEMIAAAKARWPEIEIVDDNHSDALWLLDYYQTQLASAAAT